MLADTIIKRNHRRPLGDWTAQQLRLTLFPVESFKAAQFDWWEKIVGSPPEMRQNLTAQRIFVDIGGFQDGKLVNSVSPSRIDWLYAAAEKKLPPVPFSSIGDFPGTLSTFVSLLVRWFDDCPGARRIALGGTVHLPVASREDGNLLLSQYVPSLRIDDPTENTDLMYRINRRRSSKALPGFKVNRLCTWSVAESVITEISPEPTAAMPMELRAVGERAVACQVEFDVSTDQFLKGVIEAEKLKTVLSELKDVVQALVLEGDVP